ncbi:hypothetical protein GCM10009681_33640 [Luedemannella helvata]|uniref:Uncharacterized protein n=1 Tax=Luedemannella helvata TaxID=349315 RepID=A0ABP4WSD9_9ACTN
MQARGELLGVDLVARAAEGEQRHPAAGGVIGDRHCDKVTGGPDPARRECPPRVAACLVICPTGLARDLTIG